MNDKDRVLLQDATRRLQPLLASARTAALCTHVNPDGDGIGAEICLLGHLRALGIESRVINTEALPPRYRFLDPGGAVEVYDGARHDRFLRDADLIFSLDNSAINRLGPLGPSISTSRATTVCIDHHNVVEPFWKVNIIDEQACATGELVFQIIKAMNGKIDFAMAQAAYVSLVTDTGYFRFSKTSPRCHQAAAEMLAAGVSPPKVYQEVFERNSPALIHLRGCALAGLHLECDGALAWVSLDRKQLRSYDAEDEDTSELVNELLTIDGVRVGLLLKELPGGRVKVSFRSKGDLDVNRLAARFGGGGHTNAAGAVIEGALDRTIPVLLASCRELLQQAA